jgi:predicted CoA-substrate-specific enzyme activase
LIIGIDLGSRFVKIVYGTDRKNYICKKYDTINFYKNFCLITNQDEKLLLNISKIKSALDINCDIKKIVSTGYGRNTIEFQNSTKISEIVAHFIGVMFYLKSFPQHAELKDFILLDIGGQDTKIISIKNGIIDDFFMNDKCASGSGRYLENMANVLDVKIDEIGTYFENPIKLSNTCAIFGESEIISSIVRGIPFENIASGVNYSIFSRLKNHIQKFSQDKIIFVGGMNKNLAIAHYIKTELHKTVLIPETNEFNGAFGCFCEGIET